MYQNNIKPLAEKIKTACRTVRRARKNLESLPPGRPSQNNVTDGKHISAVRTSMSGALGQLKHLLDAAEIQIDIDATTQKKILTAKRYYNKITNWWRQHQFVNPIPKNLLFKERIHSEKV